MRRLRLIRDADAPARQPFMGSGHRCSRVESPGYRRSAVRHSFCTDRAREDDMRTDSPLTTILVPTDFSAGSAQAWKTARSVAQTTGAELILLHVLPATPLDVEQIYREEERFAELRARQAAHQLGIPRTDE